MRLTMRGTLALVAVGGVLSLTGAAAKAQGPGTGSLGGYGAASSFASPGTGGGSGPMIIPYGGMFEGFMPSRMGGGSSLSYRSRPSAAMGSARTSFSLSPLSGSMGQSRGAPDGPGFRTPERDASRRGDGPASPGRERHGSDAAEPRLSVPPAAEPRPG